MRRTVGAFDAKVRQGIDAGYGPQPHAAAVATVAAIRTAEGDELLAPETGAATTTIARLNFDAGFIDEFHEGGTCELGRIGPQAINWWRRQPRAAH